MMDYVVNDCDLNGDTFLSYFTISGLAYEFEHGNPRIVAGKSGIELAYDTMMAVTGKVPAVLPVDRFYRSSAYWAGWVLAQYQWISLRSFSMILSALPFIYVLKMYSTLHEADITKFYEVADDVLRRTFPMTNLKRLREASGMSQAKLAAAAGVSLRSIQMYEQRNKDINKANAITVGKLARALFCDAESLLETDSC
jgi:DNA-binding transcriptional regulator YiaG